MHEEFGISRAVYTFSLFLVRATLPGGYFYCSFSELSAKGHALNGDGGQADKISSHHSLPQLKRK